MEKTDNQVNQWVRPEIRALTAYHVPDAANFIKLDAMENPYTWPDHVIDDWLNILRDVSLNRYPDPSSSELKEGLRREMNIPSDMEILLGNGSDELIQMILLTMLGPGRKVLAPEPSFSMYKMIATFVGLDYVGVPLNDYFELDVTAMLEAIKLHQPAVVFLAYPNNPTGNLFDPSAIRAIVEASPGLVIVDEAYHAFASSSFMGELPHYDNMLVLRTLSKMGLAGLRLGLLVGAKAWLSQIDKVRLPYNINVLTQASTCFALKHNRMLAEQTAHIRRDRDALAQELTSMANITVYPSQANFILFRVPSGQAGKIFEAIKASGVLIKSMHGASPKLAHCLRVTVGKPNENQAFLHALKAAL